MYYFDEQSADRAVSFIEDFITHTKGELTNLPMKLEKWQKKQDEEYMELQGEMEELKKQLKEEAQYNVFN